MKTNPNPPKVRARAPLAILCSDLHLSERPPLYRSSEPDWYRAMGRVLLELRILSAEKNAPIVCAGDLFDRWNPGPELINWALENLPEMYCIPGQHDLPNHNLEDIGKSAYWTMVMAGRIKHLSDRSTVSLPMPHWKPGYVILHAFPWGKAISPNSDEGVGIHVAVCHEYIWKAGHAYQGATVESAHVSFIDRLREYDVALFGDNHSGFDCQVMHNRASHKTTIWNNGAMMRRSSNEADYTPRVGILMTDGTIRNHPLDTSHDQYLSVLKGQLAPTDDHLIRDFVQILEKLEQDPTNFRTALEQCLKKVSVSPGTEKILRELFSHE